MMPSELQPRLRSDGRMEWWRRRWTGAEDLAGWVALPVWALVWALSFGRMGRPLWKMEKVPYVKGPTPTPPPRPAKRFAPVTKVLDLSRGKEYGAEVVVGDGEGWRDWWGCPNCYTYADSVCARCGERSVHLKGLRVRVRGDVVPEVLQYHLVNEATVRRV